MYLIVQSVSSPFAMKHLCILIIEEALTHGALEGSVRGSRIIVYMLHQLQPHWLGLFVVHEGWVVSQLFNWV